MFTYLVTRMLCDHKFTKVRTALIDFLYDNTELEVTIGFKYVALPFQSFNKTQINDQIVSESVCEFLSNDNNKKVALFTPKILVFPPQR